MYSIDHFSSPSLNLPPFFEFILVVIKSNEDTSYSHMDQPGEFADPSPPPSPFASVLNPKFAHSISSLKAAKRSLKVGVSYHLSPLTQTVHLISLGLEPTLN